MQDADGRTDRPAGVQADGEMKDSIKFTFIKIRGQHQNEKDADESEGLST